MKSYLYIATLIFVMILCGVLGYLYIFESFWKIFSISIIGGIVYCIVEESW